MEIADDAREHGVVDLDIEHDIEHAVRNAVGVLDQGDRDLYIGADRAGRLLEAVVLDDDGQHPAARSISAWPTSGRQC